MEKILKLISEKADEYRPIPFWSWNAQLEEKELKRQIQWMDDNAIGGFFMHARSGLKTPYLSEEWMQYIETCCGEAQKRNMKAWAYDENGWPSGFVGGKLLKEVSDRDMYIIHTIGEYDPQADVSYLIGDKCLQLVKRSEGQGEYLNLFLKHSDSTVDILNPKVTQKFLNMTHQQYVDYLGENFSSKLEGFFTDEPQYYRWKTPYTPLIQEYFLKEFGEDIFENLGLLFVEKEGYRTFRYRYWLGMQKLMLNNYAKQVYDWCDEHGVKLTGHYLEEKSLDWQLMCCGGIMPFYEYEHIPGVDWLGAETDNELPAKQVSSVARQLGKKKVITESFGCCGWDVTPGDLGRIAGFQMVNGVNLVCHHLIPYSEQGQRKRDYPAHFGPLNPWVKENFKEFNTYLSRVGCMLAEGEEEVNVAMLHPIRSAYLEYKREEEERGFGVRDLDDSFRKACRTLSSRGVSYHFLDETLMEKYGYVEEDSIGCGKCKYQYLVLPKVLTMGKRMEKLLHQYVQNGGRVLLLEETPQFLEGLPYDYAYLKSNCSLEEILAAQPFEVACADTDLYYAYRKIGDTQFLFVQNTSDTFEQTQTFQFSEEIHSFTALNPITLQSEKLPLTVTIPENGSLLLFPSKEEVCQEEAKNTQVLRFQNAEVNFETNYMTVDTVRYSKDGQNYSEEILTYQVFQKLLEERYEGDLWLRYYFKVKVMPEEISLVAEKGNATYFCLNGQSIQFSRTCEDEPSFWMKDISQFVHEGDNYYEVKMPWHQTEDTYYALFGVNVAGSLKNCVVYESEIEAIYLAGKFGVYSDGEIQDMDEQTVCADSFYIGAVPQKVSEPILEGFPFFRGTLTMSQSAELSQQSTILKIEGRYQTAKVFINGEKAGDLLWKRQLDISPYICDGENEITVEFCVGNRNLLGPFRYCEKEVFVGPSTFAAYDFEDSGAKKYKLFRFYEKNKK